jgi:hypothetical protein
MLLLVGRAVPSLGHLEQCGALLSGQEVSSHEMELTGKPPILFRFARHNRCPSLGGKRFGTGFGF